MAHTDVPPDSPSMAKSQKTVFLPEEVCSLIQACADNTGTSFTKVLEAAALAFFFASNEGPDYSWLPYTVALDKSQTALSAVPVEWREECARRYRAEATTLRQLPGGPKSVESLLDMAKYFETYARMWAEHIELHGGGLEGLIRTVLYATTPKRRESWAIDHGLEAQDH